MPHPYAKEKIPLNNGALQKQGNFCLRSLLHIQPKDSVKLITQVIGQVAIVDTKWSRVYHYRRQC
jgi:hypothetical protein